MNARQPQRRPEPRDPAGNGRAWDGLPANVREVLDHAAVWAQRTPDIGAIALVGSWATGTGHPESDVDLVVLTPAPEQLLSDESWFPVFGADAQLVRCADFGLIQERRLRRADGLEVEVGVSAPGWARVEPPDPGTLRVVRDGMRIVYDPDGLLGALAAAASDRA